MMQCRHYLLIRKEKVMLNTVMYLLDGLLQLSQLQVMQLIQQLMIRLLYFTQLLG